jgi:hypothetical protein
MWKPSNCCMSKNLVSTTIFENLYCKSLVGPNRIHFGLTAVDPDNRLKLEVCPINV